MTDSLSLPIKDSQPEALIGLLQTLTAAEAEDKPEKAEAAAAGALPRDLETWE